MIFLEQLERAQVKYEINPDKSISVLDEISRNDKGEYDITDIQHKIIFTKGVSNGIRFRITHAGESGVDQENMPALLELNGDIEQGVHFDMVRGGWFKIAINGASLGKDVRFYMRPGVYIDASTAGFIHDSVKFDPGNHRFTDVKFNDQVPFKVSETYRAQQNAIELPYLEQKMREEHYVEQTLREEAQERAQAQQPRTSHHRYYQHDLVNDFHIGNTYHFTVPQGTPFAAPNFFSPASTRQTRRTPQPVFTASADTVFTSVTRPQTTSTTRSPGTAASNTNADAQSESKECKAEKIAVLRGYLNAIQTEKSHTERFAELKIPEKSHYCCCISMVLMDQPVVLGGRFFDYKTLKNILDQPEPKKRVNPFTQKPFGEEDIQPCYQINTEMINDIEEASKAPHDATPPVIPVCKP